MPATSHSHLACVILQVLSKQTWWCSTFYLGWFLLTQCPWGLSGLRLPVVQLWSLNRNWRLYGIGLSFSLISPKCLLIFVHKAHFKSSVPCIGICFVYTCACACIVCLWRAENSCGAWLFHLPVCGSDSGLMAGPFPTEPSHQPDVQDLYLDYRMRRKVKA